MIFFKMFTRHRMHNMTSPNLTETEYLDYILGPRYLPLDVTVPLTLVYVTIFLCGIFGNFITCIVIIKNSSMQNATNFYLFSLAVSDLMLLILGLPNELSVFWQQYPWILGLGLCKIRAYISEIKSAYRTKEKERSQLTAREEKISLSQGMTSRKIFKSM